MTWLYLTGLVIVALTVLYWFISRRLNQLAKPQDQAAFALLNQNIQGMQQRLDKVSSGLNLRLDNAAKVVAQVSKELGAMQEIGRNMQDLQNFLKSPKLRGNIGEQVLHDLLSQHFPQSLFQMQYKFRSGDIVDAILKTDNGYIGIDAKFPLENFDQMMTAETAETEDQARRWFFRDVKKHIQDIAKKYIVPEEGTVNFAIMYVPSEAVYYETIRHDVELNSYAQDRKVLLVSPNSFYYFLKVILMGMQGRKIEEQAQQILQVIESLSKDSQKMETSLGVLTTHLTNAHGALERVQNDYVHLAGRIDHIKLLK